MDGTVDLAGAGVDGTGVDVTFSFLAVVVNVNWTTRRGHVSPSSSWFDTGKTTRAIFL